MNKKNGFTLVELMVVIVIIGVLAAVAIPKMMAATNKAKASEGPQMIGSIANLEHAFCAEYGVYAELEESGEDSVWTAIGMSGIPTSKNFIFEVTGDEYSGGKIPHFPIDQDFAITDFTAKATIRTKIGEADGDEYVSVDYKDKKFATKELIKLIGSYGADLASD